MIIYKVFLVLCISLSSAFTAAKMIEKVNVEQLPEIEINASETIKIDQAIKKQLKMKMSESIQGPVKLQLFCEKTKESFLKKYQCQTVEVKKL